MRRGTAPQIERQNRLNSGIVARLLKAGSERCAVGLVERTSALERRAIRQKSAVAASTKTAVGRRDLEEIQR